MERFTSVESFRKKGNTFRGIPFFSLLPVWDRRMPVLEEARTMDYVTNHNMITMAMSIFKTLKMAAECGGM